MAIKVVLWDIGNVIIAASHDVAIERLVGMGVPYMRARGFFKHPYYAHFARGTIDAAEFHRQQCEQLGMQIPIAIMRAAHDAHMYGVDTEVLEIVRSVKLPIAWATATNTWQTARQQQLVDLQRMFPNARWFCSNETGRLKTDAGAFEDMVLRLGVEAEEILFIDDSAANCDAALACGITVVQYKDAALLCRNLAFHPGVL